MGNEKDKSTEKDKSNEKENPTRRINPLKRKSPLIKKSPLRRRIPLSPLRSLSPVAHAAGENGPKDESCIFGRASEERGEEDEGVLQLRPRSSGLIFTLRHPDNVDFRSSAFGKNQEEQRNTWNASSNQRGDVLTSKTGIFGSQARSKGLRGFSIKSKSGTSSTSSSFSSCSSQEAKGWSSRSPPKELYKYI